MNRSEYAFDAFKKKSEAADKKRFVFVSAEALANSYISALLGKGKGKYFNELMHRERSQDKREMKLPLVKHLGFKMSANIFYFSRCISNHTGPVINFDQYKAAADKLTAELAMKGEESWEIFLQLLTFSGFLAVTRMEGSEEEAGRNVEVVSRVSSWVGRYAAEALDDEIHQRLESEMPAEYTKVFMKAKQNGQLTILREGAQLDQKMITSKSESEKRRSVEGQGQNQIAAEAKSKEPEVDIWNILKSTVAFVLSPFASPSSEKEEDKDKRQRARK